MKRIRFVDDVVVRLGSGRARQLRVCALLFTVAVFLPLAPARAQTAAQPPEQPVESVEQVPTVQPETPEPVELGPPPEPADQSVDLVEVAPETLGEGVPVIFRGRELIRIYLSLGLLSPEERAEILEDRLERLIEDPTVRPEEIRLVHGPTTSEIMLRDRVVGVIHGVDAEVLNLPREVYAEQILLLIQETIVETRENSARAAY